MLHDLEAAQVTRHALCSASISSLANSRIRLHEADQVVVVLAVGARDFVAGLAVFEVPLRRQVRVGQQLDGAVDGGVADALVVKANPIEQPLDRDVIGTAQKLVDDEVALVGRLEALFRADTSPTPTSEGDALGVWRLHFRR